jgi:hypothetical protein
VMEVSKDHGNHLLCWKSVVTIVNSLNPQVGLIRYLLFLVSRNFMYKRE